MSDLLFLVLLITAVIVTTAWGWTGWFLLLGTGGLAFWADRPDPVHLALLGVMLLLAVSIEWIVFRTRKEQLVPEGLIDRLVISGGTQLVLSSLFGLLLAAGIWWLGLGRFLWEKPLEDLEVVLENAKKWGRLILLRFITAYAGAVLVLWLR